MNHKHIIISGLAVLTILTAIPVSAQTERPTPAERRENFLEAQQERRENVVERREDLAERRASTTEAQQERRTSLFDRIASTTSNLRERLTDRRRGNIEASIDRITARFDAAITRLETLRDRIASRIEKFEEEGTDVSEAEAALAEADELIDDVAGLVADAKVSLEAFLDEEEISREAIRAIIEGTKGALKDAHAALVETVRVLKNSVSEDDTISDDEE